MRCTVLVGVSERRQYVIELPSLPIRCRSSLLDYISLWAFFCAMAEAAEDEEEKAPQ